jgi:hypothetical protein
MYNDSNTIPSEQKRKHDFVGRFVLFDPLHRFFVKTFVERVSWGISHDCTRKREGGFIVFWNVLI